MSGFGGLKENRKEFVDSVIGLMKKDGLQWSAGWSSNRPVNPVSEAKYRGGNILRLAFAATRNGFTDPRWMTFKQAQSKGWHVKKGSTGVKLEKWVFTEEKTVKDPETGLMVKEIKPLPVPIPCSFTVFNAQQIVGIPELEIRKLEKDQMYNTTENFIASSECPVKESLNGQNYYNTQEDAIYIVPKNRFKTNESRLATVLHEMAHSTGASSRLNRDMINGFGSEKYAKEELVAELSAMFVKQTYGIEIQEELENHAAYLKSWIAMLENDPNELFRAAAAADKASDRLINNYEMYIEKVNSIEKAEFNLPEYNSDSASDKHDSVKIITDIKEAGYKPTKRLVSNVTKINEATGLQSLKDICELSKKEDLPKDVKKTVSSVMKELNRQELAASHEADCPALQPEQ